MKKTVLSSSLLLSLILGASGEDRALLLSRISIKEQELAKIQKEIHDLRSQLSSPSSAKTAYTVKAGDTIHSIARAHKVSPSDLMTWNKISDPTRLGVGQVLTITGGRGSSPSDTAAKPVARPSASYTVEKGDTFYSIARRHNLSLKQLKALNPDVSTHLIAPGQSISVSGTPIAEVRPVSPPRKNYNIKEPLPRKIATKTTAPEKPAPKPKKEIDPPKPKPVVEKPVPPVPPTPPVVEKIESGSTIATLYLKEEMTFEEFAKKYGTTTEKLNEINGWNLPKGTVLARGSEIQYPK